HCSYVMFDSVCGANFSNTPESVNNFLNNICGEYVPMSRLYKSEYKPCFPTYFASFLALKRIPVESTAVPRCADYSLRHRYQSERPSSRNRTELICNPNNARIESASL